MIALGISLLVLAVGLFIAEAHLPSFGLLAAAGVVALVLAVIALFDGEDVTVPVVVVTGIVMVALVAFGVERGLRVSREPVKSGYEEMLGATAEVRTSLDPSGHVFLKGALWRAQLPEGADPQRPGDRVRVEAVDGLTLRVVPAAAETNDEGES